MKKVQVLVGYKKNILFLCIKGNSMQREKERVMYSIRETADKVVPSGAKVVLFGSQARGDAREDSDWDILILIDKDRVNNTDFDEIAYPLVELGWKMGVMINPILYTYKDWHKRDFTPFYKNVEQEGIVLCH